MYFEAFNISPVSVIIGVGVSGFLTSSSRHWFSKSLKILAPLHGWQLNWILFNSFICLSVKTRVSIRGVKSLGGHFACLCRGFDSYGGKKIFIIIFQKEKGNTFTLLIIIIEKSLQKEQIAQITYYEPQSAGINLQSPQSDLTPRRLTLKRTITWTDFR